MPRATMPFGEWKPDLAQLDNQFAGDVENVFSTLNSYQPIPSLLPFSNVMVPDPPVLAVTPARLRDGSWTIYAGTSAKLYRWSVAGWTDVSRTAGGAYNASPENRWSFAQFGENLTACQINDPVQTITVDGGPNFAALGGSPPLAGRVRVIGDFLVLSQLATAKRSIAWSGINDITQWTPGLELSDQQEFADGGLVQGVAGSESIGYVLQDRSIRTMQFLPGDVVYIFNFSHVVKDRGSISPMGFDTVGDVLFFETEDGFYSLAGTQLQPIGQDKVNNWFLDNSDASRRNQVACFTSNRPYVIFAYHSTSSTPIYDKLLIYNWAIQRWTRATISAQAWAQLATEGLDLDTEGSEVNDFWLDPPSGPAALPLDSFLYAGGRPKVCAVDANGVLGSLDGPNLPASLETVEAHLAPGMRAFVSDVYPMIDSANMQIAAGLRERLGDVAIWTTPTPIEITGSAPLLTSSRLHRFRVTTPPGDIWTNAQGVLAEAQPDGQA